MIEMSHTEEDLNEAGLFAADGKQLAVTDVSRKCNTALEILQNEVINCEKNISLEKSQRELNEKKLERDERSKKVSSPFLGFRTSSNERADHVENTSYSAIFTNDQFSELIENIMRVGNHFNGIEEDDVQKIIFEFAELNEINHGFDKTLRKTENEWYQRFIQSHPNLNSVIKKSFNDSVQLHKTDIEFSSRIVDKFVSDYKNSKRNAAKIEQSAGCKSVENERYEQVLESSRVVNDFQATNRDSTAQVVCTDADSKQPYFSSSCFADSSTCIESEEVRDAVSSLCSISSRFVKECSAKGHFSRIDENISNESFGNSEAKKCDDDSGVGVNSTNREADLPSFTSCYSDGILLDKSSAAATSTEATGIETKRFEGDCNPNVINGANKESSDVLALEPKTAENSGKLENVDTNRPENSTEFSAGTETATVEKSKDEAHPNTTCSNGPTSTTEPEDESDKKNPKRKHKKPTKKSKKYVYKLKSYNTVSVFQFTSSTPYSFMKPVIKLTKLDEDSFKNADGDITSSPSTSVEQEANDTDQMEANASTAANDGVDEVEADSDSDVNLVEKDQVEAESNANIGGNDSKDELDMETNCNVGDDSKNDAETTETNCNVGNDPEDEAETETNDNVINDSKDDAETEANCNVGNDSYDEVEMETSYTAGNDSKDEVEAETNHNIIIDSADKKNVLKDEVEAETNSISNNDVEADTSQDEHEVKTNTAPRNDAEDEIEAKINSDAGEDSKVDMTKSLKTTAEKNSNNFSNEKKDTPTLKTNSTNERITPTFSMQTRRKRLKFLPDGTLVTPNQRHYHFLEDLQSTPSRSESKTAKKRSLKTPPQDTHRPPEKKIKLSSSASSTPKQANRSSIVAGAKKTPKSRPDRYIPEANGKSKKPQKIFDYEGYYRENFRETEVKLPPSCKKQMIALSKVTSISPTAQSGGQFCVNPTQLLSCLLGMPITPDQIRTVRFKPPAKQLKPNKQIDISPSKITSSDAIKPITKRHLELLQKTPFNIVPKTEIGVAKSNGGPRSKPAA